MLNFKNASLVHKEEKIVKRIPSKHLYGLLVCAAVKGDIKLIKECMSREIDINYDSNVAVRLASQKGFLDIVEYLVEQGGDIEQAKIHGTKDVKEWANRYHCCTTNNLNSKHINKKVRM